MPHASIDKSELPDEIRSRVDAAAGHPDLLIIETASQAEGNPQKDYLVYAITGDQLIVMDSGLLPNGAVREHTTTSHRSDVHKIDLRDDDAVLQLMGPEGRYELRVPTSIARALTDR